MATQTTEREVIREPVYVERRGGGMGAILIGIGVLALIAIVAFFLVSQSNNDAVRTEAVTNAAANVSQSAADAAGNVSNAAQQAADNVAPAEK